MRDISKNRFVRLVRWLPATIGQLQMTQAINVENLNVAGALSSSSGAVSLRIKCRNPAYEPIPIRTTKRMYKL